MSKEKVVLAYSGGLDTSVIVRWLAEEGYEVIALCLDLGQKVEDLEAIRKKGLQAGAKEVVVENVAEEFVSRFVFPSIQMNALYEGTYLLGTSLARPLIVEKQIACARKFGATSVSHGATGKGNDQVRFEIGYQSLMPEVKIIAPWKIEKFYKAYPGRAELIEYAQAHGIPVKATKSQPWSSDENLMHISFEAGMLEDPWTKPLPEMFELSVSPQEAPNQATELLLDFEDGAPVKLNGEALSPAKMLSKLNDIAGANGVGRVDMVESRYVGMKSRGVYETPGGTVLMAAHRAIESITLTRDVIDLKDSLMPRFAAKVYSGYWFTPEMELLLSLIQQSQLGVNGQVRLELYKGNVTITGRRSPHSLYDADIASMEKDKGNYNIADANGFIRLNALPYKIYRRARGNK
ncbi:MAG: argininosuccinate synthase [Candidatus Lambdaproteobacteria bacterium RIFOXYD1_FULL_56_27]|uniref:Argininosuccinate synthase n=1 Tax=Candidatus Lambdaproteobacteria bacterium RIFOXYD2_FULL_56_26 TaxID=1817773 RepID=A0A1F6H3S0_9PROT|nr:MAG: argininosuccinate synthase [Candidatus Lambdaproteobacteria bacterium RIFOXYC1_FULL_56_13]OGH05012.1 MAG: argininosuccinate synthase [Candidatus Lambdaproteobacteria bacterium RIFOXYD2_FULL_56_26]OGH09477.1 MAG: argininosuccinate synthase [Candidatus Lambdaproteobacteria bacterium RIFOXYD1_FULL_56_27]